MNIECDREQYRRSLARSFGLMIRRRVDAVEQAVRKVFPDLTAEQQRGMAEYLVNDQLNAQARANWEGPI